ncbi:putative transmembrane and immunoglobulin domain-containing protein precursor [Penaeus vannamei]|uniref:Putative transmembrane and immunoglobulin domain-containing protein n=1 Tax=Penaeus vannamei TaxID=6689 RepID=A0A423U8L4_PENVA|nr:putative transmembrane and immunoglobulin domain-containing protein precursor [Penaeus vannamei]
MPGPHFLPFSAWQVTWLKRDEEHLLTAGGQVYSSEQRYSVSHVRHQQLWELSVRDVRLSDAGIYECQMTSHPPSSLFFYLRVVEAQAVIQGEPDVHVHTGVSLKLHCTVELATEPPLYIFWFHNDSMINYAPKRPLKVMKHNFGSSLIINNVTWDDAGSYRCEPHKAKAANLTLHVVEGEKHAALHNGQGEGKEEQPGTSSSAGGSHGERALLTAVVAFCVLLADAALARLDGHSTDSPAGEKMHNTQYTLRGVLLQLPGYCKGLIHTRALVTGPFHPSTKKKPPRGKRSPFSLVRKNGVRGYVYTRRRRRGTFAAFPKDEQSSKVGPIRWARGGGGAPSRVIPGEETGIIKGASGPFRNGQTHTTDHKIYLPLALISNTKHPSARDPPRHDALPPPPRPTFNLLPLLLQERPPAG